MTTSIPLHHSPHLTLRRIIFVGYLLALFVATHWPALRMPAAPIRSDLVVHVIVFTLLTWLFAGASWFGPMLSARNIVLTLLLTALYAAFDESTQAIPILNRFAAWDDFGANMLGIAIAGIGLLIGRLLVKSRATSARCADDSQSSG